jgi:hypothetical protein
MTSIESAWSFQGYPESASNALDADSAACAALSASLTSIRCCRHLNGCPSELTRYLKKLTWYADITASLTTRSNYGEYHAKILTWVKRRPECRSAIKLKRPCRLGRASG